MSVASGDTLLPPPSERLKNRNACPLKWIWDRFFLKVAVFELEPSRCILPMRQQTFQRCYDCATLLDSQFHTQSHAPNSVMPPHPSSRGHGVRFPPPSCDCPVVRRSGGPSDRGGRGRHPSPTDRARRLQPGRRSWPLAPLCGRSVLSDPLRIIEPLLSHPGAGGGVVMRGRVCLAECRS